MAKLLNKNYMGEGVNQTEPLDNFRESSYNDGSTWKKSNRYALKYAGDGALQSVSRGGYTTTGNLTAQPGAKIRTMQRQLNRAGYTDKFGEPLKEEGVLGAKTLFAAEQAHMSDGSAGLYKQTTAYVPPSNVKAEFKADTGTFDYDTRLSYSQTYSTNVAVLQNELAWLGYLDMSDGGWGYFGPKTQAAVNAYKNDKGLGNTGKDAGVVGKDTWSSLGLIYRTQADIDAGVKILNRDRKQYCDITEPLTSKLKKVTQELETHWRYGEDVVPLFVSLVAPGREWDLKIKESWNKALGITYPGSNPVMVNGEFFTPEQLGNATFGYMGAAIGMSFPLLCTGSSVVALVYNKGDVGNETEDWHYIKKGYDWYKGGAL